MNNETKGMLWGILGVTAFGFTLPATRIVVVYLDPVFIGSGRAVLAAFVALFILVFFRQKIPDKKQMFQLLIVALGVVAGFPILISFSMQYVPASHGGVVIGILPLATALAATFLNKEKPGLSFWLLSITGSSLVICYALIQGSGGFHIGDIFLLGAILCACIGYAVGARLAKEMGGWQVICWALIIAFPFILIPAIIYAPSSIESLSIKELISFLYLALVSQLFAFFMWYKGLALGGIARVSQVQLIQPFITIIASFLILDEIIDTETLVFAFLVMCSVWIGKRTTIKKSGTP